QQRQKHQGQESDDQRDPSLVTDRSACVQHSETLLGSVRPPPRSGHAPPRASPAGLETPSLASFAPDSLPLNSSARAAPDRGELRAAYSRYRPAHNEF